MGSLQEKSTHQRLTVILRRLAWHWMWLGRGNILCDLSHAVRLGQLSAKVLIEYETFR